MKDPDTNEDEVYCCTIIRDDNEIVRRFDIEGMSEDEARDVCAEEARLLHQHRSELRAGACSLGEPVAL
jgi:hypothetical protein